MNQIKLPLLPILDLTKVKQCKNKKLNANFKLIKTKHKFSTNSTETGNDPNVPMFGCECWVSEINNNLSSSSDIKNEKILKNTLASTTYGFPLIIVNQNQKFDIVMNNLSEYVVNIHYHGVNFIPFNDGASDACLFGKDTKIGYINKLKCKMNNNSSMCWYHPHNMYEASEFVYMGMIGLIQTIDNLSYKIDNFFEPNNNYIVLALVDTNINSNGTLNKENLYTDQWRGKYSAINGINCVNWNNDDTTNINTFYHETTKNIVKIALLQGVCSWRRYYIGICDKYSNIIKHFLIETDIGYRNPVKENVSTFSAGSRISIMIDLNDFEDNEAYIFFYNYDRTINNGLIYENVLLNPLVDLSGNIIETIPYPCGYAPQPINFEIKKFLKIKQVNKTDFSINEIVKSLQKIVFGDNYKLVKKINTIELNKNYWKFLNPKYYYNLPNFSDKVSKRRFVLFPDNNQIALINNSTEYFNGQNRIFVDMINSYEYKYGLLPTCLFKIKEYGINYDIYSNYRMDSNHLLYVNIYDLNSKLIECCEIIFPATSKPLNINQWKDLVNLKYYQTKLKNIKDINLSNILEYKWKLVKYQIPYLSNSNGEYYKQPSKVYTVQINNINKSNDYIIELKSTYSLLGYFGKPFGVMQSMTNMGNMGNMINDKCCGCECVNCDCGTNCMCGIDNKCNEMCNCDKKQNTTNDKCCGCECVNCECVNCECKIDNKCNEMCNCDTMNTMNTMNTMDNLQQLFVYAGDVNGNPQISDLDGNFKLKISPNTQYNGYIDGFLNDNLMNFSVKQEDSELWIYSNLDNQDSHPLHFHMTSGFARFDNKYTSECLKNTEQENMLLYSKDNYSISPQQKLSFNVKFINHNSYEGLNKWLGYMYHCHFMTHHDMSMMGQFFVNPK